MTPFEEAQQRANEIEAANLSGMFVSMSWGGEYTGSEDVEAQVVPTDLAREIQIRLKTLGFDPGPTDGVVGARTLKAMLSLLGKLRGG